MHGCFSLPRQKKKKKKTDSNCVKPCMLFNRHPTFLHKIHAQRITSKNYNSHWPLRPNICSNRHVQRIWVPYDGYCKESKRSYHCRLLWHSKMLDALKPLIVSVQILPRISFFFISGILFDFCCSFAIYSFYILYLFFSCYFSAQPFPE